MNQIQTPSAALLAATHKISKTLTTVKFKPPVEIVYEPLKYAWCGYRSYVEKYLSRQVRCLFVGMNPGPFGMAQTGVPFGDVELVRDWLKICCAVQSPPNVHPKRPIEGFHYQRREISGSRLWGLFRNYFNDPEIFFRNHFVINYCPLMFLEETGRNRTPDRLPTEERTLLFQHCDDYLQFIIKLVNPMWLVGIGVFAAKAIRRVSCRIHSANQPCCIQILHPSPASPAANIGWAEQTTASLVDAGIWQ